MGNGAVWSLLYIGLLQVREALTYTRGTRFLASHRYVLKLLLLLWSIYRALGYVSGMEHWAWVSCPLPRLPETYACKFSGSTTNVMSPEPHTASIVQQLLENCRVLFQDLFPTL